MDEREGLLTGVFLDLYNKKKSRAGKQKADVRPCNGKL
jgi:hypothetical protein